VQGQEDIEEPGDGYVLRQFWYFCEDTSLKECFIKVDINIIVVVDQKLALNLS